MPTVQYVIDELRSKGSEQTRKTFIRHGMPGDRLFGVSIADLKVIAKTIKGQQELAMDLYGTGIVDAMYLAGMVADGGKMTREQLQSWAEGAEGIPMIAETTVPWVALENPVGHEVALSWIDSGDASLACTGWSTYSGIVATTPDSGLDLAEIEKILDRIVKEIHSADNRIRLKMNSFVISVGTYVVPLSGKAKEAGRKIGKVSVDMGDTACKVSDIVASIEKVEASGKLGQKRKTMRC